MQEGTPYLVRIDEHADERGMCRVLDKLPFRAIRFFAITDVPQGQQRGGHAHKTCWQCLMCAVGSCTITINSVDAGTEGGVDCEFPVCPGEALVLPPRHRVRMKNFSPGAVLIVAASEQYDTDEFIKDGV